MYKLPKLVMSYGLRVSRKKASALAHNSELITPNQLGFAPIALVVLLLFGIAAGTLLVQNGVNFLPKAVNDVYECSNCGTAAGASESCEAAFSHCDYLPPDNYSTNMIPDYNLNRCKTYATKKVWCSKGQLGSSLRNTLATAPLAQDGVKTLTAADFENFSNTAVIEVVPNNTPGCACQGATPLCRRNNIENFSCIAANTTGANDQETVRKIDSKYCNNQCSGQSYCVLSYYSPEVTLKSGQKQSTNGKFIYYFACTTTLTDKDPELTSAPATEEKCSNGWKVGTTKITDCSNPKQIKAQVCNKLKQIIDINGGDSVEKLCEDGSCLNPEACPGGASLARTQAAPATATGPLSGGCTPAEIQACKNEDPPKTGGCYKSSSGEKRCLYAEGPNCPSTTKCFTGSKGCEIVRGEIRCIYPDSADPNSCDTSEGNLSQCRVITRTNLKGEAKKISTFTQTCNKGWENFCKVLFDKGCVNKPEPDGVPDCEGAATVAAPAAAAPRGNQGAPAAAPAAAPRGNQGAPVAQPASNAGKTPWDADSDGDSAKVKQVLERAANAISRAADNATDGIDAAKKVRSAYEAEFKKAYNDIFKAGIDNDQDALDVLNKELNNVSVHAYIAKEQPNKSWHTLKADGTLQRAIDHLKETGVIPQDANISASNVSTPGSIPDSDPGCGVDPDGLSIPCFKIGVFSPEELQATEAQARVALSRYDLFRSILREYTQNINDEVEQNALRKIEEAEAAAKACLERK